MGKRINFKGIVNFRDLGDYPSQFGGYTKQDRIYRSSMLFHDNEADINQMEAMNIQTIIDLRSPKEIERHPNFFAHTVPNYLTINLSGNADAGRSLEMSKHNEDLYFMKNRYLEYLVEAKSEIAKLFKTLIEPNALPAVIHCSAGKDRTGVITYLLLSLSGVDIADIIADYQVSYFYIKNDTRIIKEGHQQNIYHSYPEIMAGLHQLFTEKYPNIEDYFTDLGFSAPEIDRIKELLLS